MHLRLVHKTQKKNWQLYPRKYGNPHNNRTKVDGSGPQPHSRNEEMENGGERTRPNSPSWSELQPRPEARLPTGPGLFLLCLRVWAVGLTLKPNHLKLGSLPGHRGYGDVGNACWPRLGSAMGRVPEGNYNFKMPFQVRSLGTSSILWHN